MNVDAKALTPFALACSTCGGAMAFNIIDGHYNCPHCGNGEFPEAEKDRVEKWASEQQTKLASTGKESVYLTCKNCGAEVQTVDDSQITKCSFCDSALVKKEIFDTRHFPLALIPFAINEEEAQSRFQEWLTANPKSKAAKKLKGKEQKLRGIYLPYQLFQGPFTFEARRADTFNDRLFKGGAFINHKAIVTCKNLPNDLLDYIEPFDWSELKDFHFGYLAGLAAKTQDNQYDVAEQDLREETNSDIYEYVKYTLKTPYIKSSLDLKNVSSAPILLPIYYMNHDGVQVAVNGQTGQVGVYTGEFNSSYPWLIEPTILTLIMLIFMYSGLYLVESFKVHGGNIEDIFTIALAFSAMIALPIYIFYGQDKEAKIFKTFLGDKSQVVRNISNKKLVVNSEAVTAKEDMSPPLFYEYYDDAVIPVEYSFNPSSRVIKIALMYFILVFMPLTFALPMYALFEPEELNPFMGYDWLSGLMAWQLLALPTAIILWARLMAQDLYEYPFVRPLGGGGSWKLVQDAKTARERWRDIISFIRLLGCLGYSLVGFFLIFALGLALAMVFK